MLLDLTQKWFPKSWMFHFWPQNWKSAPVSSGPLYIYCIYFTLYNSPSCSCILIRSRPWSIRGQMYDWCYHYRPQASGPLYIYCIYFTLQQSFFRIVNVSWHGYLKTKLKNKNNKEHFGRHQKHLNHHSITEGSLVEIIASQITYRIKSTITLKVRNIKCKLKHV